MEPICKFFIELDMFSELDVKIRNVPQIIEHIRNDKAELHTNLSQEAINEILEDTSEPTDLDGKRRALIRDFCNIIEKTPTIKSAKEFYTKAEDDPSYYHKKQPNSIFFTTKSKQEREFFRNRYGIWMIGSEDLHYKNFIPYRYDFHPGNVIGEALDGWSTIREKVQIFPSSSMVVIDNYITSIDEDTNEYYGLANLSSLINNFVSKELLISDYSILIVTQGYASNELKSKLRSWIESIKVNYPKIKIQFLFSRNTLEHDRWIFFNYGFLDSGKGFKIFEPNSNIVYNEKRNYKDYHFNACKYICEYSEGETLLGRAHNILKCVEELYKREGKYILGDKIDLNIL